jgi:hypothetical protein
MCAGPGSHRCIVHQRQPSPQGHSRRYVPECCCWGKWGARFPVTTQPRRDSWEYVTPFLAFPPEVRRVIYTTKAIEALDRQLRTAVKT